MPPAAPAASSRRVLNAFRHHRGGHGLAQGKPVQDTKCSTPFGITEGGMLAVSEQGVMETGGAQRLSASQRGAFDGAEFFSLDKTCSTPFGITEGGISAARAR